MADASALVEYLLGTQRSENIAAVLRIPEVDVHIPSLCDVETMVGLRRAIVQRVISVERATLAVDDYLDMPLTRHGHQALLRRILELRENFSPYDATYLALAEQLGAELMTADSPFAQSAGEYSSVSVI